MARKAIAPHQKVENIFGTLLFHLSAGAIFLTVMQTALFQSYIAGLYSLFVLLFILSMSEKDSTAFQKGHFCSPCSPK